MTEPTIIVFGVLGGCGEVGSSIHPLTPFICGLGNTKDGRNDSMIHIWIVGGSSRKRKPQLATIAPATFHSRRTVGKQPGRSDDPSFTCPSHHALLQHHSVFFSPPSSQHFPLHSPCPPHFHQSQSLLGSSHPRLQRLYIRTVATL